MRVVKKVVLIFLMGMALLNPIGVMAQRGCCSWHGGVAGCDSSGKIICNDGTLSPSCTCAGGSSSNSSSGTYQAPSPSYVYGCTDPNALNYNASANKDDGSCIAKVYGCMDQNAINYNASANTENDSCQYEKIVTKKEKVKYKKEYKDNESMLKGEEKVVEEGKDGEKEVTYKVITDKDGNIISKESQEEKIITEAKNEVIEQGTKETSGLASIITIFWIIGIIVVLMYKSKDEGKNILFNKIKSQQPVERTLLYIFYFILVIPVLIDTVIIIINKFKVKNSK